MLDLIRKKKEWLKWILWPVIIALGASMLFLFVATPPSRGEREMGNFVADVDGVEISVNAFQSSLLTILNYLGPDARRDQNTIRQYGNMTLMRMVRTVVLSQEAERYGLKVTDDEVFEAISKSPGFNNDGNFIGTEDYRARLKRLGTTPEDYEMEIRRSLLSQKLENFITSSAAVSDKEVEDAFTEEHNQAKIRYVSLVNSSFYGKVQITDADLQKYYDAHKDQYRIDETRQIKYILLDTTKLATALQSSISDQDIRAEYDAGHEKQYQDMIRASHILFKIPQGATPAEVDKIRQKAAMVLEEARRPGANFAELASRYSEDEGSAKQGGDLNFFPRGRMVKEFENAVFDLKVGQISDLVQSQFGFHIIKVTGRRDYEFFKPIIARKLAKERAESQLQATAEQTLQKARQTKNLDALAKEVGGIVETSQPFNEANPDFALGNPKGLVEGVFKLKLNEVGDLYQSYRGYIIPQLTKIIPAHVQPLAEVKNKVDRDCRGAEAARLAREEAQRVMAAAQAKGDLEKVAKEFNIPLETTELFTATGSVSAQLGKATEVAAAALRLEPQAIGGPIESGNRQVVFQVLERVKPDMQQLAQEKEALASRLLEDKKRQMFEALVATLIQRYQDQKKIQMNEPLIERLLS
jgi:peptidyl-prolyl cis-trans isomerase D